MDKQGLMELLKHYNLDHGEAEVWPNIRTGPSPSSLMVFITPMSLSRESHLTLNQKP